MRPKVLRIAALVGVAVAALLILAIGHWPNAHRLTVKTYFSTAGGLREGATVRVAGVDIGRVKSVRVRPELGQEPVEVVMILNPTYELKIPSDAIVSLQTAGVLGETYVAINIAGASGPPLGPNAVLKARRTEEINPQQFVELVGKLLEKKNCDCNVQNEKAKPTPPASSQPSVAP